jgi:hypothetical protein
MRIYPDLDSRTGLCTAKCVLSGTRIQINALSTEAKGGSYESPVKKVDKSLSHSNIILKGSQLRSNVFL